uniref:Uncharacterized protein n=1 Tax=Rhizophora mucronata TaxID=61149 RepID=A0A2P2NN26_RHIMU
MFIGFMYKLKPAARSIFSRPCKHIFLQQKRPFKAKKILENVYIYHLNKKVDCKCL